MPAATMAFDVRRASAAHCAASCAAERRPPTRCARTRAAPRMPARAAPSARATADQTRGAGVKAPGPTSNRCRASNQGASITVRRPYSSAAGRGGDALDDFLLQHHVQVVDVLVRRRDVKQQRRGDVVGQVADDAQACCRACARSAAKSNLSASASCSSKPAAAPQRGAQLRGEIAVDLDGVERAATGRSAAR